MLLPPLSPHSFSTFWGMQSCTCVPALLDQAHLPSYCANPPDRGHPPGCQGHCLYVNVWGIASLPLSPRARGALGAPSSCPSVRDKGTSEASPRGTSCVSEAEGVSTEGLGASTSRGASFYGRGRLSCLALLPRPTSVGEVGIKTAPGVVEDRTTSKVKRCCFDLLNWGWGRGETRPPVALGSSPELSACTMSLAPLVQVYHLSLGRIAPLQVGQVPVENDVLEVQSHSSQYHQGCMAHWLALSPEVMAWGAHWVLKFVCLKWFFLSFFLGFRRPNLITGLSGWRAPD